MDTFDSPSTPPSADRLAFETLISDTSAALMQATPVAVDAAVEDALQRVRTFFRADRAGLLKVAPDMRAVNVSHAAYGPGVSEMPKVMNLVELFPWAARRVLDGEPLILSRMADLPPEAARDRATFGSLGTRSNLTVPITSNGVLTHLIILGVTREERLWPEALVPRLRLLGELLVTAVHRAEAFTALDAAHDEVRRLRDRLERENVYLRNEVAPKPTSDLVSGRSPAVLHCLDLARQVAPTASTVLILGETGTGKERLATYLHEASPRRARHMVRLNCSAIPSALIETELFGREKGAYTGALSRQIGRFELAHESTLFLDEIGDLPLEVQVKLLRVIQERTIERLGSPTPIPVDVRLVAATHRDLDAAVRAGSFRSDLYYRLNVFPIVVPALRERRSDIPQLATALVDELSASMRKKITRIDPDSLEMLQRYDWPGNVRELRNVLERAMILEHSSTLHVSPPPVGAGPAAASSEPVDGAAIAAGGEPASRALRDLEREHILRVLQDTGWRIRGPEAAAGILGIKPTTLEARMKRLGIRRPGSPLADH